MYSYKLILLLLGLDILKLFTLSECLLIDLIYFKLNM